MPPVPPDLVEIRDTGGLSELHPTHPRSALPPTGRWPPVATRPTRLSGNSMPPDPPAPPHPPDPPAPPHPPHPPEITNWKLQPPAPPHPPDPPEITYWKLEPPEPPVPPVATGATGGSAVATRHKKLIKRLPAGFEPGTHRLSAGLVSRGDPPPSPAPTLPAMFAYIHTGDFLL